MERVWIVIMLAVIIATWIHIAYFIWCDPPPPPLSTKSMQSHTRIIDLDRVAPPLTGAEQ